MMSANSTQSPAPLTEEFSRGDTIFRRHRNALTRIDQLSTQARRVLGVDVFEFTDSSTRSPIEWILDLSAEEDFEKTLEQARNHIAKFEGKDVWFEVVE